MYFLGTYQIIHCIFVFNVIFVSHDQKLRNLLSCNRIDVSQVSSVKFEIQSFIKKKNRRIQIFIFGYIPVKIWYAAIFQMSILYHLVKFQINIWNIRNLQLNVLVFDLISGSHDRKLKNLMCCIRTNGRFVSPHEILTLGLIIKALYQFIILSLTSFLGHMTGIEKSDNATLVQTLV